MVYDLDIEHFLNEDVQNVVHRVMEFYDFERVADNLIFHSKFILPDDIHFASNDADKLFATIVPKIKSLHNDMYRIIESIHNAKTGGTPDVKTLEDKYALLTEFRVLNNKFKHYSRNRKIKITNVTIIDGSQKMELQFLFFDKAGLVTSVLYSQFINLFLKYLEDNELITIN